MTNQKADIRIIKRKKENKNEYEVVAVWGHDKKKLDNGFAGFGEDEMTWNVTNASREYVYVRIVDFRREKGGREEDPFKDTDKHRFIGKTETKKRKITSEVRAGFPKDAKRRKGVGYNYKVFVLSPLGTSESSNNKKRGGPDIEIYD